MTQSVKQDTVMSQPKSALLHSQVSDVCGVCFGGTVEALAARLGMPTPDLSIVQRGMQVSRLTASAGAAIGVIVGCVMGMGTLLFMDTTSADREKKQVGKWCATVAWICASCVLAMVR